MVTKSTEAQKGGSAYFGIGNDGFRKYSVSFSTGLMDNGWAITFMAVSYTHLDVYKRQVHWRKPFLRHPHPSDCYA